jgi:hypothetical protein
MKTIILLIIAASTFLITSCGADSEKKDNPNKAKADPLVELCECAKKMKSLRDDKIKAEDEIADSIQAEIEELEVTCQEIVDVIEKGKSKEEIKAKQKEFMENCDAF